MKNPEHTPEIMSLTSPILKQRIQESTRSSLKLNSLTFKHDWQINKIVYGWFFPKGDIPLKSERTNHILYKTHLTYRNYEFKITIYKTLISE